MKDQRTGLNNSARKIAILGLLTSVIALSLTGCGQSNADRLAHKWVVSHASFHFGENDGSGDSEKDYAYKAKIKEQYEGNVYDIRKDGTLVLDAGASGTFQGTWKEEYGSVRFSGNEDFNETWRFYKDDIKIFANKTLTPRIGDPEGSYVSLELVPAEGEEVKTDY